MVLSDPFLINGALRALVYLGTILAAGSCLFALTFPTHWPPIRTVLRWQIAIGAVLVAVVEPLRYVLYALAMAGGDVGMAFEADMLMLGFELPAGQASLVRLFGVAVIALAGLRYRLAGIAGCIAAICSYALEGHTAGDGKPVWMALLLLVHVGAIHWWIGSLWPLAALARTLPASNDPPSSLEQVVERFGKVAAVMVGALLIAGAFVLVAIIGWLPDPTSAYQQFFAAKLAFVLAILALAAFNRFRVTPSITRDVHSGAQRLCASIRFEIGLALSILVLTGFITITSPGLNH